MNNITIAIDVMSGDHGLNSIIPACIYSIKKNPEVTLLLVGDQEKIFKNLKKFKKHNNKQLVIIHSTEIVAMDESPIYAIRNRKNSSMRIAINLVKNNIAQACVSAGNTGALVAISKFVLKTLPGINRPAIITELPTISGKVRVIDLGANIDSCAENLFQFAIMGSALIQAIDKKNNPKVALLNIGIEKIKGNDQIKKTSHILNTCSFINYVGYIEHFYSGKVDLIVCDGFIGNIALKASEGLAKLIAVKFKQSFSKNLFTKIIGYIAMSSLIDVKKNIDPDQYNGASLLGLNGIVIKSHGGANKNAFHYAIEEAIIEAKNNVVNLVRNKINEFFKNGLLL